MLVSYKEKQKQGLCSPTFLKKVTLVNKLDNLVNPQKRLEMQKLLGWDFFLNLSSTRANEAYKHF